MWLIWLERNRRTFEDIGDSIVRLKGKLLAVLYFWDSRVSSPDALSLIEFLDILAV